MGRHGGAGLGNSAQHLRATEAGEGWSGSLCAAWGCGGGRRLHRRHPAGDDGESVLPVVLQGTSMLFAVQLHKLALLSVHQMQLGLFRAHFTRARNGFDFPSQNDSASNACHQVRWRVVSLVANPENLKKFVEVRWGLAAAISLRTCCGAGGKPGCLPDSGWQGSCQAPGRSFGGSCVDGSKFHDFSGKGYPIHSAQWTAGMKGSRSPGIRRRKKIS